MLCAKFHKLVPLKLPVYHGTLCHPESQQFADVLGASHSWYSAYTGWVPSAFTITSNCGFCVSTVAPASGAYMYAVGARCGTVKTDVAVTGTGGLCWLNQPGPPALRSASSIRSGKSWNCPAGKVSIRRSTDR